MILFYFPYTNIILFINNNQIFFIIFTNKMLKLRNIDTHFPKLYPKVERKLGVVGDDGWTKVDGVELRKGIDFMPQPGLQEIMITEDVDIQLLGGQPGGGKTLGLLLAALDGIDQPGYGCLIIKKQLVSTKSGAGGIIDDAKRLYMGFAGCEFSGSDNPTFTFPEWGTSITFTHANFSASTEKGLSDAQEKFKNFQDSRIFVDEATDHDWKIVNYLLSRNRDSSHMKSKFIMTFNTNSHHFTRVLIDWWLKELPDGRAVVDPAKLGKIRYCHIKGNTPHEIVWGDSREELVKRCNIVIPEDMKAINITPEMMVKSITFRPCKMTENRILMSATQGGHAANVFNLGSTETNKLFYENWNEDTEGEATVSKQMISNIWINPYKEGEEMYGTLDVADGGDNCALMIWKELTITAVELFNGDLKQLPPWIEFMLNKYGIKIGNFAFDATGVGSYLKAFTNGRAITSNVRPIQEIDEAGNPVTTEQFFNIRSQLMGKTQFLLETGKISCTIDKYRQFPHGKSKTPKYLIDILQEESDVFRMTTKGNKYYYNNKIEFKSRYGYSPDYTDIIVYRSIFILDGRARKEKEIEFTENDYIGLY